jgi:hypothetical protein
MRTCITKEVEVDIYLDVENVIEYIEDCDDNDFERIVEVVKEMAVDKSKIDDAIVLPTHNAIAELQSRQLKEYIQYKGVDWILSAIEAYKEVQL